MFVTSSTSKCTPGLEGDIIRECQSIQEMLIAKNRAYGNSALDPLRIFSKASVDEQLNVRIDDKLSRILRGSQTESIPEDTIKDLIGYLILKLLKNKEYYLKCDASTQECTSSSGILRKDILNGTEPLHFK